MELYRFFPKPSDRMGCLWVLNSIKDAYVVEFGPAGTTHFAIEAIMQFNAETRAKVYTTDIDDSDISFGKTDRIERAVREIDKTHSPEYIFVMASSISAIIGTDIESVCMELQEEVGAKLIPIDTGGYRGDYSLGIEETLSILAKEILRSPEQKCEKSYNIIGNTIDTYNFLSDENEIRDIMKGAFGMDFKVSLGGYSSVGELERLPEASYNLVVRSEGLKAAEMIRDRFGIDYCYGRPYGVEGTASWIDMVSRKFNLPVNRDYVGTSIKSIKRNAMGYRMMTRELSNKKVVIVGDLDTSIGIASMVEEFGLELDRIFIKHSIKANIKETLPNRYRERISFDAGEMEIEDYLSSKDIYLLLGDGGTLNFKNRAKAKFQISNPNLLRHNIYHRTPFLGFNGALYFLQNLYEIEKSSRIV